MYTNIMLFKYLVNVISLDMLTVGRLYPYSWIIQLHPGYLIKKIDNIVLLSEQKMVLEVIPQFFENLSQFGWQDFHHLRFIWTIINWMTQLPLMESTVSKLTILWAQIAAKEYWNYSHKDSSTKNQRINWRQSKWRKLVRENQLKN